MEIDFFDMPKMTFFVSKNTVCYTWNVHLLVLVYSWFLSLAERKQERMSATASFETRKPIPVSCELKLIDTHWQKVTEKNMKYGNE